MDSTPDFGGIHDKLDAILERLIGSGAYKPGPPMKHPPSIVTSKGKRVPIPVKPLPNYVPGKHPPRGRPLPFKKGTPVKVRNL